MNPSERIDHLIAELTRPLQCEPASVRQTPES